jgi:hypothetical protein
MQEMMNRETLDRRWKQTIAITERLPKLRLSEEYQETHSLINLLDRKIRTVINVADIIREKGDQYDLTTFEGHLLGGLNDLSIDIDFHRAPAVYLEAVKHVAARLTVLQRFLAMANQYFIYHSFDKEKSKLFLLEIYPQLMGWVRCQSEYLTASKNDD